MPNFLLLRPIHVGTLLAGLLGLACGGGGNGAPIIQTPPPSGSAQPDLVILAIGERPYAEYMGDSTTLALPAEDIQLLTSAKAYGVPIVTVMFSGRPLIINDVLTDSAAFLAAWLPGSEMGGLADVLFGTVKPSGKLNHTWPASLSQVPINQGDGQTPLFELGYGLTYP
jgi:beta-glucosidase